MCACSAESGCGADEPGSNAGLALARDLALLANSLLESCGCSFGRGA